MTPGVRVIDGIDGLKQAIGQGAGVSEWVEVTQDMIDRFAYLTHGLALILVFVGAKMLLTDVWKIPTWLSLLVIVAILTTAIAWSLRSTRPPAQAA